MSGPTEIKKYSFNNIFIEHPTTQINSRLAKGYLCRREVTELLDHIQTDSNVSLTTGFKWKIGGQDLDTNEKTNNIPFWLRRICHWFNLKFSSSYKAEFKEKIRKVHQAFDTFKTEQLNASPLPQPEPSRQAEARDLEELRGKISSKRNEISGLEAKLNELNTTHQQLEDSRQAADQKIQGLTDTHTTLSTLNSKLNTYFLKGAYLEDKDEPIVQNLEKALYGENNSTGQLRTHENRTTQLSALLAKKENEIRLRDLILIDLNLCAASIREKETARAESQAELTAHQLELDTATAGISPSDDDSPSLYKTRNPIVLTARPDLVINIVHEDLFESDAEVIVNAANVQLGGGGGIDGAIHRAGGADYAAKHSALKTQKPGFKEGDALIIEGVKLKSTHRDPVTRQPKNPIDRFETTKDVIVTAGPTIAHYNRNAEIANDQLHDCYYNALQLAHEKGKTSIAFPSISTGIFEYPKAEAAKQALKAINAFIENKPDTQLKSISIHCFDPANINEKKELDEWGFYRQAVNENDLFNTIP